MTKKITSNQLKFIQSLRSKKYRDKEHCFLVEGKKGVGELFLSDFEVVLIACTNLYFTAHEEQLAKKNAEIGIATEEQMARLGSFQSNNSIVAVAKQPPTAVPSLRTNEFALVLDDIRDPGNLGTIIRTADWFGIHKIIASAQTVEFYNPKVISATMGSFSRVQLGYTSLVDYLSTALLPVYGMLLDGQPIGGTPFDKGGLVVIGNESRGISAPVAKYVENSISIPRLGGAESLNAAIATGIILYAITTPKRA